MAMHVVRADIAGTVVDICVAVGDHVEEGDPMIIIESMKMQIPVTASEKGTIQAIMVEKLQAVNESDVIANIEIGRSGT